MTSTNAGAALHHVAVGGGSSIVGHRAVTISGSVMRPVCGDRARAALLLQLPSHHRFDCLRRLAPRERLGGAS